MDVALLSKETMQDQDTDSQRQLSGDSFCHVSSIRRSQSFSFSCLTHVEIRPTIALEDVSMLRTNGIVVRGCSRADSFVTADLEDDGNRRWL